MQSSEIHYTFFSAKDLPMLKHYYHYLQVIMNDQFVALVLRLFFI